MPTAEQLRERLEEIGERLHRKTVEYDQATASRDEIQRKVKRLEARKEAVREEAEARKFIPGSNPTATAAKATKEVADLEERIEEAEGRIERLKAEKDALREEQKEVAGKLARKLVDPVTEAEERWEAVLAEIGAAVLPLFVELQEVAAERSAAGTELKGAVSAAAPTTRQKQLLRAYLRHRDEAVEPEALLGFLVADVLNWARMIAKGPIPELLKREGVRLSGGTARHQPPVGAVEEVLAALEDGRLPPGVRPEV